MPRAFTSLSVPFKFFSFGQALHAKSHAKILKFVVIEFHIANINSP